MRLQPWGVVGDGRGRLGDLVGGQQVAGEAVGRDVGGRSTGVLAEPVRVRMVGVPASDPLPPQPITAVTATSATSVGQRRAAPVLSTTSPISLRRGLPDPVAPHARRRRDVNHARRKATDGADSTR